MKPSEQAAIDQTARDEYDARIDRIATVCNEQWVRLVRDLDQPDQEHAIAVMLYNAINAAPEFQDLAKARNLADAVWCDSEEYRAARATAPTFFPGRIFVVPGAAAGLAENGVTEQ